MSAARPTEPAGSARNSAAVGARLAERRGRAGELALQRAAGGCALDEARRGAATPSGRPVERLEPIGDGAKAGIERCRVAAPGDVAELEVAPRAGDRRVEDDRERPVDARHRAARIAGRGGRDGRERRAVGEASDGADRADRVGDDPEPAGDHQREQRRTAERVEHAAAHQALPRESDGGDREHEAEPGVGEDPLRPRRATPRRGRASPAPAGRASSTTRARSERRARATRAPSRPASRAGPGRPRRGRRRCSPRARRGCRRRRRSSRAAPARRDAGHRAVGLLGRRELRRERRRRARGALEAVRRERARTPTGASAARRAGAPTRAASTTSACAAAASPAGRLTPARGVVENAASSRGTAAPRPAPPRPGRGGRASGSVRASNASS